MTKFRLRAAGILLTLVYLVTIAQAHKTGQRLKRIDQLKKTWELYNAHPQDARRLILETFELRRLVKGAEVEFVGEMAEVAATTADGEKVLLLRIILEEMRIRDEKIIEGLAPQLDSSNRMTQSFAGDWFQYHDVIRGAAPESLQTGNYALYVKYIQRKRSRLPENFVRYVFSRPDLAFRAFHAAWQPNDKDLQLAEHTVSHAIWLHKNGFADEFATVKPAAITTLATLAVHKEWWVRLYVAKTLWLYPELQTDETVAKLADDSHHLVKAAMLEERQR